MEQVRTDTAIIVGSLHGRIVWRRAVKQRIDVAECVGVSVMLISSVGIIQKVRIIGAVVCLEVMVEARTGLEMVLMLLAGGKERTMSRSTYRYSLYEVWLKRTFMCSALERGAVLKVKYLFN